MKEPDWTGGVYFLVLLFYNYQTIYKLFIPSIKNIMLLGFSNNRLTFNP